MANQNSVFLNSINHHLFGIKDKRISPGFVDFFVTESFFQFLLIQSISFLKDRGFMPKSRHSSKCSICSTPLQVFKKKKCDICGSVICNNCCYREKGVRGFIRALDNLPNVMCNRCLFVHQTAATTKENEKVSPTDSEKQSSQWINKMFCI